MMGERGPVLIAGRSGQVAHELARVLRQTGRPFVALGRGDLDLADPSSIARGISQHRPSLVINAAAYTGVDKAEDEPTVARAVNATGAGLLAAAASRAGAPIVHISTDYVFDGTKPAPYLETDATAPLGVYGATKLEGERLVAAANPRHVIVRTAWVFSPHGHNFVKTMLRLGTERDEIAVVADQSGAPTAAADLAEAIAHIASRLDCEQPNSERFGIFHAVNAGATTWHAFACAIMDGAKRRGAKAAHVRAISSAEYQTRARRPANSALDTGKLLRVFDFALPAWELALERCLDNLIGSPR
ncbi:MAG: dTDP-4-dehydrorhamnose reductase [Hyphomicrobiaceae bacterium]|nr:dTDP-4-dehydrorhamnose reductase [Hyphomicrobiaceae bacterium]